MLRTQRVRAVTVHWIDAPGCGAVCDGTKFLWRLARDARRGMARENCREAAVRFRESFLKPSFIRNGHSRSRMIPEVRDLCQQIVRKLLQRGLAGPRPICDDGSPVRWTHVTPPKAAQYGPQRKGSRASTGTTSCFASQTDVILIALICTRSSYELCFRHPQTISAGLRPYGREEPCPAHHSMCD